MLKNLVDIGNLITSSPEIQHGSPIIAGTGTSVKRIVALYKQGYSPDEIKADKEYLTLAQIYAALAYYYTNQQAIEEELAQDALDYERLSAQVLTN
ncbi:MAG: DUF433 domain-containing protein [Gloeocapsa sp. DLM2.Bin57]|nr:MAG: DUF433 domain-containing protein [Gloeocapsa sp. DLM2.Bin57]